MPSSSGAQTKLTQPFVTQRPWIAAFLFGTVITPAGVVLGWLAPRPLDALVALPLVLLDIWAAREGTAAMGPFTRILLLALGIVLTWLLYVLAARAIIWRLAPR